MRMLTTTIAALGVAGALSVATSTPSSAQGFYVQGPGVSFGVGTPGYQRYYRNHRYQRYNRYRSYDSPYAYSYGQPYYQERGYYRGYRNW
jgi:hypothetical protein